MSEADRELHVLLNFVLVLDGRPAGLFDPAELFDALRRQVPDLTHDELVGAADCARSLGRQLRGLAWRLGAAERAEEGS
jgi:hypothetical protein